jgi:hypothetical protein
MTLSSSDAPTNPPKTTKTTTERGIPHVSHVHQDDSKEPSMTYNQTEIILEAITKNLLSMQRMLLDLEYKLSSKLMTVEELSQDAIS